jgi:hypothetical protein
VTWKVYELGGREVGTFASIRDALPSLTVLHRIEGRTVALVGFEGKRPVEFMVWFGR